MSNNVILTDAAGKPIPQPRREDFASAVQFVRAFHDYKNAVANAANDAFDREFAKLMEKTRGTK